MGPQVPVSFLLGGLFMGPGPSEALMGFTTGSAPSPEGLDTEGNHMGPAAPVKTGCQGEEPLAGSTPCVLPHIRAGESALSTAPWEGHQGLMFGDLLGLPQASSLADDNPAPCLQLTWTVRTDP